MVIEDGAGLYFWDAPGGGDCFPDPYAGDSDNRIYGKYPNGVHPGCRVSVLDDVLAYYSTKVDVDGFWLRQLAPRCRKTGSRRCGGSSIASTASHSRRGLPRSVWSRT